MEIVLSKKHTIIRGTLILTSVGFLCRIMGFFYRIFLSHTFGEEGVGLYQLVFPVFAFALSFTCAGLETAISRTVARKVSLHKQNEAREILLLGIMISSVTSFLSLLLVQKYASPLSIYLLGDARCELLLVIFSYALPFASIHCCVMGYCYGLKQTKIPAISQLIEQISRILCVFVLYYIFSKKLTNIPIAIAAIGLVFGEFISTIYALQALQKQNTTILYPFPNFLTLKLRIRELIPLSLPLTANRVVLNLLQSIEAVSIPGSLKLYNHSTAEALRIYGVLTGMALPCILFPSAITSSISIMLMPTVAEIQAVCDFKKLQNLLHKVLSTCFLLGLFCCLFFLIFGKIIGRLLFDSTLAGDFLITLSWICPFLYVNSSLQSVINGLGKTSSTFFINMLGLFIRIGSVFFAIPSFGIKGYLWGLLISQLSICLFSGILLWKYLYSSLNTK